MKLLNFLIIIYVCLLITITGNILYNYETTISDQERIIINYETHINAMYDIFNIQLTTEAYQERLINDMNNTIIQKDKQITDYKEIIEYKDSVLDRRQKILLEPTFAEVTQFLSDDKTDQLEWIESSYDCTQFSLDVMRNAFKQGIYSCVVRIDLDDGLAHNLIAFKTSDAGIQYFEPQTDKNVFMYPDMDYASYLDYPEDVSMMVRKYDSCFARVS